MPYGAARYCFRYAAAAADSAIRFHFTPRHAMPAFAERVVCRRLLKFRYAYATPPALCVTLCYCLITSRRVIYEYTSPLRQLRYGHFIIIFVIRLRYSQPIILIIAAAAAATLLFADDFIASFDAVTISPFSSLLLAFRYCHACCFSPDGYAYVIVVFDIFTLATR